MSESEIELMDKLTLKDRGKDSEMGDRISELPDHILLFIHSFLTIKEDVQTSILSRRWRYLWASRPNLDFDIRSMFGKNTTDFQDLLFVKSEFVRRVDHFMHLYRGPKICRFRVRYWASREHSYLDRWIETAITMGVETLELILVHVSTYEPLEYGRYRFPCFLHQWKQSRLKYLHLDSCILWHSPDFSGFKNLVMVALVGVILQESSLQNFFSGCVLLEVLSLKKCTLPANLKAVGTCVNLKRLEMIGCHGAGKIVFSAVKLTTFRYIGKNWIFSSCNFPHLEKLSIKIWSHPEIRIPSVLTELPNDIPQLESLYLSLPIAEMKALPAKLASFTYLKQLELSTPVNDEDDLLWIAHTLDVLPFLSKLHVMLQNSGSRKERKMTTFGCPHHHLKEVVINGFRALWNEMELVIYLLQNAVVLERMVIDPRWAYYDEDGNFTVLNPPSKFSKWSKGKQKLYQILQREVPHTAELVICHES